MKRAAAIRWAAKAPRIYLILALLAVCLPAAAAMPELVLEVTVNGQDQPETLVVLRDQAGAFWMAEDDYARLRLAPAGPVVEQQGQRYRPLAGIPGAEADFDMQHSTLSLRLPAAAFSGSRFSAPARAASGPAPAATGAFLNYQLSGQRVDGSLASGAYTELGVFSRFGVLSNTMATRQAEGALGNVRLESALSRDIPARLQTLTLGDAIADPGAWGTAYRFAGLRFARNFAIRPDLITAPLLSANGSAVVPSSVDVFVNDQRVLTQQVQPGPFVIDRLPAVSGAGDLRIVVRDALGRDQVLTQSFYSSPVLLAQGLDQYSFSLGSLRENYALRSFDYGSLAASATWRRGLTDRFTAEAHAEAVSGDAHAIGADIAVRVANLGITSATLAAGGNGAASGWLAGAGFEHRGPRFGMAAETSYASGGYRGIGETTSTGTTGTDLPRRKLRSTLQFSAGMGQFGAVTLAAVRHSYYGGARADTFSLDYGTRLGRAGSLNLSFIRDRGQVSTSSVFLTFSKAWGSGRSLESAAERVPYADGYRSTLRSTLSQAAPPGTGSGWRLGASARGDYDAWWQQRFTAADMELQSVRNAGVDGQSLQLRGSATLLGGTLRPARSVDGSFALVDVGGLADVPVYVENQLVAHTDQNGRALLHNLRSYESNQVSIEPADLPLDVDIAARSMIVQPAWRSGVIVKFPVERIHAATFRLLLPDGTPVPAGATVRLNGGSFTVAMGGFTYVTTLDHGVGASAAWSGGACVFRVEPPPADDPQPDMGDITCRPETPRP